MLDSDSRPPLLTLGLILLAVHDVLLLAALALGGLGAALVVLLGARDLVDGPAQGSEAAVLVFLAGVAAIVLVVLVGLVMLSLTVCALAWRGGQGWLRALIGMAVVHCVVLVPNPLGVLASILCVLGGLEALESAARAADPSGPDESNDDPSAIDPDSESPAASPA